MVFKSKSEVPIKPLSNVKEYSSWQVPSINAEGKVFRQVRDDNSSKNHKSDELIVAEELQALKDKAYNEGFEKGRHQGLASAEKDITEQTNLVNQLLTELANPIQQCGEQTQQELLELCLALSRQIVRREIKQDPTQLIAIIREALKLLPIGSTNIRIVLHPEDAAILRKVLSINKDSPDSRWQLVEEPSMARGGCTLKTDNSTVDASVDRQIAVLFNRMVGSERTREDDES